MASSRLSSLSSLSTLRFFRRFSFFFRVFLAVLSLVFAVFAVFFAVFRLWEVLSRMLCDRTYFSLFLAVFSGRFSPKDCFSRLIKDCLTSDCLSKFIDGISE